MLLGLARRSRAMSGPTAAARCAAALLATPASPAGARCFAGPRLALGALAPRPLAACALGARSITLASLRPSDVFEPRHNSLTDSQVDEMARVCGFESGEALVRATVPAGIVREDGMPLDVGPAGETESQWLERARAMAGRNVVAKNFLGQGYYGTTTPPVILRNVLENPGWYTQYTPYQAEIAQGRLEVLLAFQTVVSDLTGLPLSNASLLDEATSAAEAMGMCRSLARGKKPRFLVSELCHPQTIAVCKTRAPGLGLVVEVVPEEALESTLGPDVAGVLVQYPSTDGAVGDYAALAATVKAAGSKLVVATDLLALTKLVPPGEFGADIAVGSAQRFGVPLGFGGPHAGFLACAEEHKRLLPGRVIGVSRDAAGSRALRMALQTREQHIRRDKATSNICTAQALLANMASLYAIYHGPDGIARISDRVSGLARVFAAGVAGLGLSPPTSPFFDTVKVSGLADAPAFVRDLAASRRINLRVLGATSVAVAFDETHTVADVDELLSAFAEATGAGASPTVEGLVASGEAESLAPELPAGLRRATPYLSHPIFSRYHSEHEMLRYLKRIENRDFSLAHGMIPLGSCTMKLNATSEMIPITLDGFANVHPFAPADQTRGYDELARALSAQLATITGFQAVSLQPNSGAAGEYAGLLAIRAYHASRGEAHRDVCLIPTSAHGTNPASAAMAGLRIVPVPVLSDGSIDVPALSAAAAEHADRLACLMVTYPSTVGIYEDGISAIVDAVHANGGQVYMDGANMNAQVGLTAPGIIGADVCHLNLHKTFCIPHGGGGPGVGPICVAGHLAPFLPTHPTVPTGGLPGFGIGGPDATAAAQASALATQHNASAEFGLAAVADDSESFGVVSAAPLGSALILPISHGYISMMGSDGLRRASERAIVAANYMAARLGEHYRVLHAGRNGTVAHEFILDIRPLTAAAGVDPEDIAKRLIDYGFHAPTMSWPVAGTLMVEPTESESKEELDRFVDAMIAIRAEIAEIERGEAPKEGNVLKRAPHTAAAVAAEAWDRPYTRDRAAFPSAHVRAAKFWPSVERVDNVFGDRTLVTLLPEDY